MPVTFLGYNLVDFINDKGEPVKGLKFYFYHESQKHNYHGFEVDSYFCDYVRDRILYDIVMKCVPGQAYDLDLIPSFSGKTIIKNLIPIK